MPDASLLPVALDGLLVVLGAATAIWLLSLLLRDAGIADVFWGPGFALLAWIYLARTGGWLPRGLLVATLVTLWGLRLAGHIFLRGRGKSEDRRYARWRERAGSSFWWKSWFSVFLLQGVILWVVAWPLLVAVSAPAPRRFVVADLLGLTAWTVGFLFEAVADAQLRRFRRDPANRDRVLSSGLWKWSRHPNYFGDALLWWGLFCFSLSGGDGWATAVSPLLMTFLLLRVSGVTLLERDLSDRKPEYRAYVERTSAFVPLPPKRAPSPQTRSS